MKNGLLSVLLFLLAMCRLNGQQLSYKHFTTDDGLPSSEVYDVFQDSKGFIWMATDHGLTKFDGYTFKTFNTDNGLPDNTIFKVKEDYKGILWVQTFSKGIYSFDGEKFKPHPQNEWIMNEVKSKGLDYYNILGDTMFLGNTAKTFACYKNSKFKYWQATDPYNLLKENLFLVYAILPNNDLLFTVSETLPAIAVFPENKGTGRVRMFQPGNYKANINFTYTDSGKMAFSSGSYLYIFNQQDTAITFTREFKSRIISLYYGSKNRLWISQYQGGVTLATQQNGKLHYDNFFDQYSVTDILEDREGNYWFSTLEAGVFFVPGINFIALTLDRSGTNAVATKALSLLVHNHQLYIGSDKSLAYTIDTAGRSITKEYHDMQSRIEDLVFVNGHVATSGYYGNINFSCKCYGAPLSLEALPGKNRLAAGAHQGFSIIENDKTVYCSFNNGFAARTPAIRYSPTQGLLLGTNEGLYVFRDSVIRYYFSDSLLHDIRVTDLKITPSGWIVVATRGKGLVLTNGTARIQLTEKDGMISNLLECVYPESDSSFWIGSYSGLSHLTYNPAGSRRPLFINYTKKDGLSSNEINDVDYFNGEIWLATNNGLCHFKPKEVAKRVKSFPIYMTSLTINGQTRNATELQHLKHDENNIVFEMTGLDYKALGEITYSYVVEGKNNFKGTSRLRRISFFAMEPGDYRVRITAKSVIGDTSAAPYVISFTIPKHYTQTTWFAGIMAGVVLCIILLIVYLYYQNRQIKAETRLQVMEAEQAALRSQMNPHFIFNVLNSIQSFLGENDRKQAQNFLGKFSQLIRRILENSKHTFISLEEEIRSLRLYLQLEQMRFEDKVSYNFEISPEIDQTAVKVPPMMLQPMIENAILHGITPSGRNGVIEVKFAVENGMLVCTIRDNGVGLSAKKEEKNKFHESTAVNNLRKRIELLNRVYGTNAGVEIQEIYDNGMTAGTEAKLSFPLNF